MDNQHLESLNTNQKQAVLTIDGPLLVLAGAGTGKTRVLTTRINHILASKRAFSSQILAVTFTNKAAREMKERLEHMTNGATDGLWLGTFHSIAARILRRNAKELGFNQYFTIIDLDDQLRLAKQIFRSFNIDDKKHSPKSFIYQVSRFKDKGVIPTKISVGQNIFYGSRSFSELYNEYQNRLQQINSMDFGDLILNNIELFNYNLDILKDYQNKFKYILVDEYQDTNIAQYIWLRQLAQAHNNICCVGDDDQSIYGWRGAEVTNILKFDKDFENSKIIRLERNYRSTKHILSAATSLIGFNSERHGKILWTELKHGEKIKLSSFYDEKEEGQYVAEEIDVLTRLRSIKYSQIAILYRAGYQSRNFEENLNFLKIPYKIIGGMRFYERAEIRDVIAYIRVLTNSNDSLAFERIVNTPKRGIGSATIQNIQLNSRNNNISSFASTQDLLNKKILKGRSAQTLQILIKQFIKFSNLLKSLPHTQIVDLLLQDVGYIGMWTIEDSEESKERLDNIKELVRSLDEYSSLYEFLEHVSLVSDNDNLTYNNTVSLMTMHAAKGLEFNTVFLPGWEEGTFPSQRSIEENGANGLEEERRLAYVAITRARERLYITFANARRVYGNYQYNQPSRFVNELPSDNVEIVNNHGLGIKSKPIYETIAKLNQVNSNDFSKGKRVFHIKFGYGVIIKMLGDNAEIAFEKTDVKKILIDYLTLVKN